ncbi:TIGR03619 family F420-dependent LLM class oxidoreductase [Nocardia jejuensis]|uniref:TIGR03619 family F420-dependent LLM class oxidoreductase n=1 Tax=Nocardia jejuensis TaxID=328049 RepID=UPI00082AB0B8|nr:TIGR03619 family F420-dependent LLM class oxidoreductase [Nocardia jejuensis]
MRYTYAEAMTNPDYYVPLAQAAEQYGFHSITIADSVAYPAESDSKYPYTPDGNRDFLEDKPFIETFVLSAAIAAATTTLRLTPFVLKLPIRPPVLVAKQASSLARLSNNRFALGVGISPWPEDFQIMGVPFERRGKRLDECIEIVKGLSTGEYFEYHGEFYDIQKIKMTPAPTEPLPILVGGHSDAALRRAVRLTDGWMHAGGNAEDLDKYLARIDELRSERDNPGKFEIHAVSYDAYTPDGVKRVEEKGITDVIVGFRNSYAKEHDTESLEDKIAKIKWYGDNVISKVN